MPAEVVARRGQPVEALKLCEQAIANADGADLDQAARVAATVASEPDAPPEVVHRGEAALQAALARKPDSARPAPDDRPFPPPAGPLRAGDRPLPPDPRRPTRRRPRRRQGPQQPRLGPLRGTRSARRGPEDHQPVIDRHPKTPQYLATRGAILTRLQQYDRAIADLRAAIAIESTPVRQYHLARAYRAAGQDAKFREHFQKARQDGLNLNMADPTERGELASLLQL